MTKETTWKCDGCGQYSRFLTIVTLNYGTAVAVCKTACIRAARDKALNTSQTARR